MELRLLEIAFRVLDPRRWRQRLRQLFGALGVLAWVWFRAVNRAEVVRAVADARHFDRDARIQEENAERELERIAS